MGVDNGLAPTTLASSKISRVYFYRDMKILLTSIPRKCYNCSSSLMRNLREAIVFSLLPVNIRGMQKNLKNSNQLRNQTETE